MCFLECIILMMSEAGASSFTAPAKKKLRCDVASR